MTYTKTLRLLIHSALFWVILTAICLTAYAQDSVLVNSTQISSKYLSAISSKADKLNDKLDQESEKAMRQMAKLEARMKRKLARKDSSLAATVFGDAEAKYKTLEQNLSQNQPLTHYLPFLDTVKTSFKFLEQKPGFLSKIINGKEKLKESLGKINSLESQFQKAEDIKKFLKERKQFLKEQLGKLGFTKELKKLNKQVFYFNQQIAEYKAILKDSKKAERKALELLSKTTLFQSFMQKHSRLASLFRIPFDPNDPTSQSGLTGLQTRAQVNNFIQNRVAGGGVNGMQQLRQNISDSRSQIQQLKDKIGNAGGSSDDDMPDFKVNNQKSKSFGQRLEYGINIQSQKGNNLFPNSSDIGLSIGYKINDKSVVGIGAAYKIGWGTGLRNIQITQQGLGFRSYLDWQLKASLWISGGFELNYRSVFNSIAQLRDLNAWQRSGLIGLSKKYRVGKKFKGSMKLLWDFMSYTQLPHTQAIIFRIGYGFK